MKNNLFRLLLTLSLMGAILTFATTLFTYERLKNRDDTGSTWESDGGFFAGLKGALGSRACPTQLKRYETVNVLIAGVDAGEESGRTDSIHVMRLYNNSGHAGVVSIPRDSFVPIDGTSHHDKINAAYATGGAERLKRTVENFMGEPMDHYVVTDLDAFVKVVDEFGGVDITVEKNMRYHDRHGNLHIDLKPGRQHLNGTQTMGYVRFRHDRTGDFGRIVRQQTFAREFIKQKATLGNIGRLRGLFDDMKKTKKLETDMEFCDFFYMREFFKGQDMDHRLMPAMVPGTPMMVGRASIVRPDAQQAAELEKLVFKQPTPVTFFVRSPVELVNTCGYEGRGEYLKALLRMNGIRFSGVRRQPRGQPATTVLKGRVPLDMAGQLNVFFGGKLDIKPPDPPAETVDGTAPPESPLTLVLGNDACRGL